MAAPSKVALGWAWVCHLDLGHIHILLVRYHFYILLWFPRTWKPKITYQNRLFVAIGWKVIQSLQAGDLPIFFNIIMKISQFIMKISQFIKKNLYFFLQHNIDGAIK